MRAIWCGISVSPGFALFESSQEYTQKNLDAFNYFLEKHLPKYHDAYNSLEYTPPHNSKGNYYLLNAQASIYSIYHVKTKYKHLSEFCQFQKFLDIIHLNLGVIDSVVCEIAKYAFAEPNFLNQNIRQILRNFLKKGNVKKNSLNAAYDLFFLFTARAAHDQRLESFNGKIDSWCMTADNGITSLARLITFPSKDLPCMLVHNESLGDIRSYLELCDNYFRQIAIQRSMDLNIRKGITDIDNIIIKAENLINTIDVQTA